MRYSLLTMAALLCTLTACHKDKHEKEKVPDTQSVLVYVAGDNNLTSRYNFFELDLKQMIEGSKNVSAGNNLLCFVDVYGQRPYLMKVENGDTLRVHTFKEEMKSSDPATLQTAMNWMKENYPALSYGLVLWGHADGWVIWEQTAASRQRRAYGQDKVDGEQWMNIPDMARTLETFCQGQPLRFIFADCCCFQCVESDYELRNVADYIIASAAEIPGEGAPYKTVVPALFSQRTDFYQLVCDAYFEQVCEVEKLVAQYTKYQEPLSVVKTSAMEPLAQATKQALKQTFEPIDSEGNGYPNVSGLIYYYDQTLFDMNDVLQRFATPEVYNEWKQTFDQAVAYKTYTPVWMSNGHVPYLDYLGTEFRDFQMTEERYGGVSMFLPQNSEEKLKKRENTTISQMQWYAAVGLQELGWGK